MSSNRKKSATNFLQLSRSIMNTPYYRDKGTKGTKGFTKGLALIDLLLLTQYETKQEYFNGELVTFERGHIYHSKEELARRWGWGDSRKVTRFLDQLKNDGYLEYKTSKRGTDINMLKYDELQGYGISDGISQSLENEAIESLHGISDGRTDGRTDSTSDSRTDSTQEIKKNNLIRRSINDGTRVNKDSVRSKDSQNEQRNDPTLRGQRDQKKADRTSELSEYAHAIRQTHQDPTEW